VVMGQLQIIDVDVDSAVGGPSQQYLFNPGGAVQVPWKVPGKGF